MQDTLNRYKILLKTAVNYSVDQTAMYNVDIQDFYLIRVGVIFVRHDGRLPMTHQVYLEVIH